MGATAFPLGNSEQLPDTKPSESTLRYPPFTIHYPLPTVI